ncbi:1,2-phenylacetyl-CoA epoxidase subunit PaaC [Deinococcus peraridilitoris]|uniref:Phenylacetate-CoA oxygenase, PaaI subunit n=1 Tax=Deinococcus peraridilitoris (strain DSM 19664 / LMG 22246 / CIP 109416 / KR-200) TaxID=937777 RepID=L0A049_DEIPD|nr:1,2-phenylacetyl-CoA epoxidase subunit PaaC [Deinococcus peraridilitoris]AFZ66395.1 phenylacetate-CoA oxygenase, PaaI subunit [Deinococcus peraridilitoris DSM 19664]
MTQTDILQLGSELRTALILKLTALADDELILSHRNSEWVGHAPILEEDIALANLVQDELGHAQVWLSLRAELDGSDPDALAYGRGAGEYRCAQLVELPRGDWAFTLLRQFLFDAYELVWLGAARESTYTPLSQAVQKIIREERFHLQHTRLWVERLGLGTEESRRRTQNALNELWPLCPQLFALLPGEDGLVKAGVLPSPESLFGQWQPLVAAHLEGCGLTLPTVGAREWSRERHTEHLAPMLAEMQEVARWDPSASEW